MDDPVHDPSVGVLVEILGGDDGQNDVEVFVVDQDPAQDGLLGLGAVGRRLLQKHQIEFHASPPSGARAPPSGAARHCTTERIPGPCPGAARSRPVSAAGFLASAGSPAPLP